MLEVGVGLSRQRDPVLAAKEATHLARVNLQGAKADVAIIVSSISIACPTLLKVIGSYLPGVLLLGSSTGAIISHQGIFKEGLIIMLLALPKDVYFNCACAKEVKTKTPLRSGEELGEKLLQKFHNRRRDVGIIFSDGLIEEAPDILLGLQKNLGRSFPIAGASASDNLAFKKTYLYFNQEVLTNAVCGIMLGGKLNFGLGTKHGWKPLGKPRRVTRAQGNIVNEIDNAPAVKIYEDYLARDISELKKELKRLSIFYPIGIYLAGEQEFLLRNVSSVEPDGSLVLQGNVPQNSEIRLMIGTRETCLKAIKQAVDEVKKSLFGRPIKAALVFDSVSRQILLGRQIKEELRIMQEELGKDTPLIGLYTYGEQAPLRSVNYLGSTYFHNQTITILGIAG